jgi:hypothetical protein
MKANKLQLAKIRQIKSKRVIEAILKDKQCYSYEETISPELLALLGKGNSNSFVWEEQSL